MTASRSEPTGRLGAFRSKLQWVHWAYRRLLQRPAVAYSGFAGLLGWGFPTGCTASSGFPPDCTASCGFPPSACLQKYTRPGSTPGMGLDPTRGNWVSILGGARSQSVHGLDPSRGNWGSILGGARSQSVHGLDPSRFTVSILPGATGARSQSVHGLDPSRGNWGSILLGSQCKMLPPAGLEPAAARLPEPGSLTPWGRKNVQHQRFPTGPPR